MTTVTQLLQQLPDLSDEQLKQAYFNRAQGTKLLVQMLPLVAQESLALRLVKLALEVDWKLAAKLAGAVKPQFQPQAVSLIAELKITLPLKNRLLGMTGSDSAIPQLLQSLSINGDARSRRTAARALVKIGSDAAVSLLLRSLASRFYDIQGWAAWSLSQIASEATVRELRQALSHNQSSVRNWAVWALGEINSDAAFAGLLETVEHPDFEVRWRAVAGLGKNRRQDVVSKLLKALEDRNEEVRAKAASALGQIGEEVSVSKLVNAALNDRDEYVSFKAIDSLVKIGGFNAESGVMQALRHSNRYIRFRAVSALKSLRGEAALAGILEALQDKDYMVRGKAADELGWLGNNGAIAGLLKALDDPEYYVRWRVAAALGLLGGEGAVAGLVRALDDERSTVRQRAAKSLGEIGSKAAISALQQAASHKHNNVRAWASVALQKIENEAAVNTNNGISKASIHNLPNIFIVSQLEASEKLRDPRTGRLIKSIISIGNRGTSAPLGFDRVPNRLRLEFDDLEEPHDDPELKLPPVEDIYKAIEFAPSVARHKGTLLVHCRAGISRSSAIALTVFATLLGPGKEEQAMAYVMEARPIATPNLWIVELADEALGRDGKLVDAAQLYQDFVSPGHVF